MEPVQPEASVVQTGLGLRYIGSGEYRHCYAFSGAVIVGNETIEALAFQVGSGYIIGKVFFAYDITGYTAGEEIGYQVKLNDLEVFDAVYGRNIDSSPVPLQLEILLPPFTKTQINFVNTDDTGLNLSIVFTGRVYGAE